MQKYILIGILMGLLSCKESTRRNTDNSDSYTSHWYVYLENLNTNFERSLVNNTCFDMSPQDSALLHMSGYLDIVIGALVKESGGLNVEDLHFSNPNSMIWVTTLDEINFMVNFSRELPASGAVGAKDSERIIFHLQDRLKEAKENNYGVEKVSIELRLLQYGLLTRAAES